MTLSPLLKVKVDELFLRWLSNAETQQHLRNELQWIVQGNTGLHSQSQAGYYSRLSPTPVSTAVPGPPPSSPTSLKSPRSPRRRSSSTQSRSTPIQRTFSEIKEDKNRLAPGCARNLPRFYFPNGVPKDISESKIAIETAKTLFSSFPERKADLNLFSELLKALQVPHYWRKPLFSFCGGSEGGFISFGMFSESWTRLTTACHDDVSRFFKIMASPTTGEITRERFEPLIQDIISDHPGLQCLRDAPEFHTVYKITVISRIFFTINRSWSGRITLSELRKSNFLEVLSQLEVEEDINQIPDYFSYEHFYVIYCKFWELDTDHDLVIDDKDLSRYCNGALSQRIINRIFSGCVTRGKLFVDKKMEYSDFVWFLVAEIDKKNTTSIEYWFRCMDLDGDGILSMYELEYFYEDQIEKMQRLSIEVLAFRDCLCQMLDMVKPKVQGKITLKDLKACPLSFNFFDTFLNLDRWLEYEQRDPFQGIRDLESGIPEEMSDWEKFAMNEYEILVAEEGSSQEREYEDDFDFDDDLDSEDLEILKGGLDHISDGLLSNAYLATCGNDNDDNAFY